MEEKNWRDYINYGIIGIISVIVPFLFACVGSVAGLAIVLPTTLAGWIVFVAQLLTAGGANISIYHCFQQQAKINIKNDKHFISANEMLNKIQSKTNQARSPKQYFRQAYGGKFISLFITSTLAAFSLGQAVLIFNVISFISHALTMLGGVIFSYFQMKQTEQFWTDEYYIYAQQELERQKQKEQEQNDNDKQ